MKGQLQKKLFEKYPSIFQQKDLPMTQTCMCWGIETGDGWYDLIDNLCKWISNQVKWNPHVFPLIEFTQVKEKYGGLRIYFGQKYMEEKEFNIYKKDKTSIKNKNFNDWMKNTEKGYYEISGVISFAEALSYRICEICGKPGKPNKGGWISTLCDKCRERK